MVGVSLTITAVTVSGATVLKTTETEQATVATAPASESPQSSVTVGPEPTTVPVDAVIVADLADIGWVAETAERTGIPPRALAAYAGADLAMVEESGCQVGWNTLAGIAWVESHHGTLHGGTIGQDGVANPAIYGIALDGTTTASIPDTDGGALDGDAQWDRAVGPMQFIPQTWAQWGHDGNGDGIADPHNIDDAALTAAAYLCHAHGSLEGNGEWIGAIRSYNDTNDYQNQVATAAQYYADRAA